MRKRPPSIDFYYDDFYSGVAGMHPLAVGMYIRSLCFQWGHDLLPSDPGGLYRILGVSEAEFDEHWEAVAEKFVQTEDGRWFNERAQESMEHKLRVSEKRSESGKKGGRPTKSKSFDFVKAKRKQNKSIPEVGSRKLEEGRRKKEEQENSDVYTPQFNQFWEAFPRGRRKSKGAAATAFEKAIAFVDAAALIQRATDYAESDEGRGEYVKMPSTWLNQRCWEDEPEAWKAKGLNHGSKPVGVSGRIRGSHRP